MNKTVHRLALLSMIAAVSGCSWFASKPAPAPKVGGECSYSTQVTLFTAASKGAQTNDATEIVFNGVADDLPSATKNAVFVGTFTKANEPKIDAGQAFPGKIQTETKGTCTPIVYAVVINGVSYSLEPKAK